MTAAMRPLLLRLILVGAMCLGRMTAAQASSTSLPPSQITELAARLAAAPDDAARNALLDAVQPSKSGQAAVYTELGVIQQHAFFSGDLTVAEALARCLETLAIRIGDRTKVYSSHVRQADVHRLLGEFSEALALIGPALDFFEAHHDVQRTVSAAMARGIVYIYQADYAHALADFQHALTLSEANGYRDGAIPALNSIGEVFREQGEPARALEYYARARAWLGDDTAWNNTFIFNNIAQSYVALGDYDKAVDYLGRSGAIAEKTGQKPRAATELAVLGDLYRQHKQFDAAQGCLEHSLTLSRETHDMAGEGRARLGLAELASARGDHLAASALLEQAAASYRRANQPAGLSAALTALGHEQRVLGHPVEARASFNEAISVIESVRGRLAGGDLEAQAYFENKVSPYQETVALLADEPDGALTALQTAEQAKARVLLDIVRRGVPETDAVLTAAERAREADLTRTVAALDHSVTVARAVDQTAPEPAHQDEAERQLRQARADWDSFQRDMLIAHPVLSHQRPSALPLTPKEIFGLTDGGKAALLEFVVTDDATYLLVVTGGQGDESSLAVRAFPLAISRETLGRRAEALRAALAQRGMGWQEQARVLYDDLLKPSASAWQTASRLIIVPDGPLWNLPFQALEPDPGRYLCQDHSISYAPSLTLVQRSVDDPSPIKPPRLLAFGNPVLSPPTTQPRSGAAALTADHFSPLPEAERQLAMLATLYPAEDYRSYVGEAAHEDTFKREAGRYDILHLATHGILNGQNPLYSYLLMAQTHLAPDEDGLLEARELMGLHLHARVAILSACETGRGRFGAGEGLMGLSWAFSSAGCTATVVSQWKVDSASTTDLMIEFHRRLLAGDAVADALRTAELELAKNPRYRHPFYWAPFVLVGTDHPIVARQP